MVERNGSVRVFFCLSHNEYWYRVIFIISLFKHTFVGYETSDESFLHLQSTDAVVIQEKNIRVYMTTIAYLHVKIASCKKVKDGGEYFDQVETKELDH